MNWVSDLLSGLSLAAVVVIGVYSIRLGRRSTTASERSARASEGAAKATLRSLTASEEAAKATLQSVSASEEAARLAAQDALVRRLEAALETVIKMRHVFNVQNESPQRRDPVPAYRGETPAEHLERLALSRELEARMVTVAIRFGQDTHLSKLAQSQDWTSNDLEPAITKLKDWIKEAALPRDATKG